MWWIRLRYIKADSGLGNRKITQLRWIYIFQFLVYFNMRLIKTLQFKQSER